MKVSIEQATRFFSQKFGLIHFSEISLRALIENILDTLRNLNSKTLKRVHPYCFLSYFPLIISSSSGRVYNFHQFKTSIELDSLGKMKCSLINSYISYSHKCAQKHLQRISSSTKLNTISRR